MLGSLSKDGFSQEKTNDIYHRYEKVDRTHSYRSHRHGARQ